MTTPNIDLDLYMPFAIEWEKRDGVTILVRTDSSSSVWTELTPGFAYQIVLQNNIGANIWLYSNNGNSVLGRTMMTADGGGTSVQDGERKTFTVVARPGQRTVIHLSPLNGSMGNIGRTAVARVIPMPIISK